MAPQAYKRCSKCGEVKPLEEFHRHRSRKDGRRSSCKPCHRADARRWRQENPEKLAAMTRRWAQQNAERKARTDREWRLANRERKLANNKRWASTNPETVAATHRRWNRENPEKVAAHTALRNAVKLGKITKPDRCEGCGGRFEKRLIHGHHENYSEPLEVRWLCPRCHKAAHRGEGASNEEV